MKFENFYNLSLVWRPKTDLDEIWSKNFLDGLIKLVQEFAKSITKINSKVHKPKTYNEPINNLINKNRWQKAINKEFWNLNSYQT